MKYYKKENTLIVQDDFEYANEITCVSGAEWGTCCTQATQNWVHDGYTQIIRDEALKMLEVTGRYLDAWHQDEPGYLLRGNHYNEDAVIDAYNDITGSVYILRAGNSGLDDSIPAQNGETIGDIRLEIMEHYNLKTWPEDWAVNLLD